MRTPAVEPEADFQVATADLASQTIRGVSWTAAAQVARQVLQMAFSIVVARLLLPEEFGMVAQVVVLTGLAHIIADFGLGAALVQRRSIEERHRSSVFWMQAGLGLAVSTVVAAAAPLIAAFYGEPDLGLVALALAPNFLLASLCTVQRALLTRAMRFRALAMVDVGALALSGVVCVAAAASGAGVFALVAQTLAATATATLLLWRSATWRPGRTFDPGAIRELLPFSRNLLGFTFITYTIRNSDNLLVGRLLGATALGLYTRGYSLLLYPTRQISSVVGKVMFASLSRLNDDVVRLRRAYLRTVSVIALITFPLMIGLALVAEEFVLGVLGEQWSPAIPVVRIFCLLGAGESVITTVGWIYQSTGRTDVLLRWGLFSGAVPLLGIVIGSLIGTIEAVTVAYAVSTSLLIYPAVRMAGRLIGMTFSDLARALAPVAACTVAMAGAVLSLSWLIPSATSPLPTLLMKAVVGAVVYLVLLHVGRVRAYGDLRSALPLIRGRGPA